MNNKKIFSTFLLAFIFFATANDTYMNYDYRSGAVFPLNNENIKMVKETVNYDYRNSEFNTVFWMKNTTNVEQKVTIGFPIDPDKHKYRYNDDSLYDSGRKFNESKYMKKIENDINFKTWINDKEVNREFKKIESKSYDYKYAFVTDIVFKPLEELIIKNKYTQQMGVIGNTVGLKEANLKYDPTTGSAWKDSIDYAYFEFIVPKEYNLKSESSEFKGDFMNGRTYYTQHFQQPFNNPAQQKLS
ncbi:MAG: hypothetical protein PF574_02105 [Candidatus Delongbacteria bacterium]|jgi:hypothetical protein|nr:hypothetical protein [Candidatus Delongbacteria bacterium]